MSTTRITPLRAAALATAALLSAASGGCRPTDGSGPSVVALLVIRQDRIAEDTVFEILPLTLRTDSAYRAITGWEVPGARDVVRGDSILRVHPRYAVFRRGERIGSVVVDTVVQDHFDCSELFVGKGQVTWEVPTGPAPSGEAVWRQGSVGGEEVDYGLSALVALDDRAPALDTQHRSIPGSAALTADQRSLLVDEAGRRLAEQAGAEAGSEVDVRSLVSYDLDGDGTDEHLLVAGSRGDDRWHSVVLAGHLQDGAWVPLLAESRSEEPDAWGDGYRLLDVLDLDGDAVPEVVFEVGGYEATSYRIFRFTGDAFEEVFSEVLYGC